MAETVTFPPLPREIGGTYITYETLTALLHDWRARHPRFVHLRSIGQSEQGRELWLLTLGPDPERQRPSAWVDGNMHGSELAGAQVALAIAYRVIQFHEALAAGETTPFGLPPSVVEALREVRFFVLPRMCPDGAETTLTSGAYVRSNPRDHRDESGKPRWIANDVDGDGRALLMRQEHPAGEFCESTRSPGLLLPRTIRSAGPFYRVFPEGHIQNFDGSVPDPHYLSDNDTDLNRNFPYTWRPEPEQVGAGRFPLSEPESRAVVEFATREPNIYAWLNLHTFGGVYIRPLGAAPDHKMAPQDLALYREVGVYCERYGGYPMVSGFAEFLYEPEKPLYGDLSDFAYAQRGAVAYVCEIWDLFAQLGIERKKPFVDHYTNLDDDDIERLYEWDQRDNHRRIFQPWRPFVHPQLGPVEVGGLDIRIGITNPPPERLADICDRQTMAFLHVAAMAPRIEASTRIEPLDDGLARVHVELMNRGYLPSYVLASAQALSHNTGLAIRATTSGGVTLVDDHAGRRAPVHLEGWGRGRFAHSLFHLRSRGSVSEQRTSFLVRIAGDGALELEVESPRTGRLAVAVALSRTSR
jgi:hypothetical protein